MKFLIRNMIRGYNYTIQLGIGSHLILLPDDEDEGYPIEESDIAQMIKMMYFSEIDNDFKSDDLIDMVRMYYDQFFSNGNPHSNNSDKIK